MSERIKNQGTMRGTRESILVSSRKTILFATMLLLSLSASCSNGEHVARKIESTGSTSKAETPVVISFEILKHPERESIPPSTQSTPQQIKNLAGKQVMLAGFLSPCLIAEKRKFVLAATPVLEPSYQPLSDELVIVTLKEDWEASEPIQQVKIRGVLEIQDFFAKDTERCLCVYQLVDAEMEIVRYPR